MVISMPDIKVDSRYKADREHKANRCPVVAVGTNQVGRGGASSNHAIFVGSFSRSLKWKVS